MDCLEDISGLVANAVRLYMYIHAWVYGICVTVGIYILINIQA